MHSGRPFEFLFPISALFLLSSTNNNTTTAAAASSSMEQLFRGRGRVIPRWMRTGWSERRSPHPHPHPHLFIGVDRIIVHFSSDFSCRRQSTPTAKSTPKSTNFRFLNRSKFGDSSPNFRLFSSSAEFFLFCSILNFRVLKVFTNFGEFLAYSSPNLKICFNLCQSVEYFGLDWILVSDFWHLPPNLGILLIFFWKCPNF